MTRSSAAIDTPHADSTLVRIRSDLNLEKWVIWLPARSKTKQTRTLTRQHQNAQGDTVSSEVTIGYVDRMGTITTEDQKTFYALIKIWDENGRSTGQVYFSIRMIARILRKKWGTNVITATTESLMRLRAVPLIMCNAYYDSREEKTIEILDALNLLSELKIVKRHRDGQIAKEAGYFRFHDLILASLLNHYTKPVLLDVYLKFKRPTAQLLYTHLDLIMSRRRHYERRSQELFDDLGIQGAAYRYVSDRKRTLDGACQELCGIQLTSGIITRADLEQTTDGLDYKIVIDKVPSREWQHDRPTNRSVNPSPRLEPDPIMTSARALVQSFYRTFHGTEHAVPPSKAISQAVSLLARYGPERAAYLIDFSHGAAAETGYKPQTFGGILHYQTQAFAAYDAWQSRQQQQQAIQSCTLCDRNGFILFERCDTRESFSTKCPHDERTIEQYEKRKGCQRL